MPGTRELKRRIKSITGTKKITRAMQVVSAVKMRKAQIAAISSRTYSDLAWQIITNLSGKVDPKFHRLLEAPKDSKKIAIILVTTNRGLVGGFNANLIHAVNKFIAENKNAELTAEIATVGRKGRDASVRVGHSVFADFEKQDHTINISEILPLSRMIIDEYIKGTYSKVVVVYSHFISTINQKPVIKQLFPLVAPNHENLPERLNKTNFEYLFEPDPQQVLDHLVPRIIESQVFQAILESDASEHSARMVMMKNATDAASDLITDLTLEFNKLRQSNITKELAEITAGRIALE
jgi:F-type H+-transporting ATPase subunit gamma